MNSIYMGRTYHDKYYCLFPIQSPKRLELFVNEGMPEEFRGGPFIRNFLSHTWNNLTIFPQEKEVIR